MTPSLGIVLMSPRLTISVVAPAGGWGTRSQTITPDVSPSESAAAPTRAHENAHEDRRARVQQSEDRERHVSNHSADQVAAERIPR